ncbi:MAG TPA: HAD family hydrolase [Polyangiaceae bacterium]|nr:HAD family hydrolase [Polyangiaceae bacterium]
MPLQAILLDLDGTLVDSNDAHAQAWIDTLREFGHRPEFQQVRRLIGKGGDKLLPEVTGVDPESELGKRISKQRSALFRERFLPELKAFPGSRALLQRMHDAGIRLVVATSAQKEEMGPLLRIAGAEGLLYDATNSSEAENSKPDPDIIEAALRKAGCSADEALMLGDTPYDIQAAAAAGVRTVAVRCGGWSTEELEGALAVYDGPEQLLAAYEASPFATRAR